MTAPRVSAHAADIDGRCVEVGSLALPPLGRAACRTARVNISAASKTGWSRATRL